MLNEVYDLFIDLDATEEQLDFPVLYTNARAGTATPDLDDAGRGPAAAVRRDRRRTCRRRAAIADAPLQMLVANLDSSDYLGPHRDRPHLQRPRARSATRSPSASSTAACSRRKVTKLYAFDGLKRVDIDEAAAGDIVCLAGIEDITIGETIADVEHPIAIPPIAIDEPTVSMIFGVNTSPMAGRDGQYVTSRQLQGSARQGAARQRVDPRRADRHARADEGHRPRRAAAVDPDRDDAARGLRAAGVAAGDRHQGDQRRRSSSRSRSWSSTCPRISRASSSRRSATRKGMMTKMVNHGSGRVRLEFRIPARGLIGFRSQFLTDTQGHRHHEPHLRRLGAVARRRFRRAPTGALVADRAGVATAYAICNLQERGEIFIDPATQVYEGMIIGENARAERHGRQRHARKRSRRTCARRRADEAIRLIPPRKLGLEQAIEFINDDELVEVTPKSSALRKRILAANMRPKVYKDKD